MKIKEVLALTMEMPIKEIAKNHLSIGEKPTREALKNAGCYTVAGKKGWYSDNEEIIEHSIYDYCNLKKMIKIRNENDENDENDNNENTQNDISEKNKNIKKPLSNKSKNNTPFNIDEGLYKKVRIRAIEDDKKIYEIIEEALRIYLHTKK
jgi:hypothetical protein